MWTYVSGGKVVRVNSIREYAVLILRDHQQNNGGCYCGREVFGTSHAEHLIDELKAAGIELCDAPVD